MGPKTRSRRIPPSRKLEMMDARLSEVPGKGMGRKLHQDYELVSMSPQLLVESMLESKMR